MPQTYSMVIDGALSDAQSGETLECVDPASGQVFAHVAAGGKPDIDSAVKVARRRFSSEWVTTSGRDRGRLLRSIADKITARGEELAQLETTDNGKPLTQSRNDVRLAAQYFEYYAGIADKIHGETIPVDAGVFGLTFREPYGVTGHIIPWNYPLQIAARTVSASLASGNCCVVKPADEASLSVVVLAQIALDAGLPAGVLNIVPGTGESAGAALAEHPGIDYLAFTGSREVGRLVMKAAANHTTPLSLELGGKSPHVVLANANLDTAIPTICSSVIQNAGQTCSAGSRVIVDRKLAPDLIDGLAERFSELTIGPGIDDPDVGPLISKQQLDRVRSFCEEATTNGAETVIGGGPLKHITDGGFFFSPTVFTNVDPESRIANEEVFGPVLSVFESESPEDALHLANQSQYGLVGAVWSRDINEAVSVARRLEVGQAFINTYGAGGGIEFPFGGWKASGFGREKGLEAISEFTQTKTVVIDHAAQ